MQKINEKSFRIIFTNAAILIIISLISFACFYPQYVIPIYSSGGDVYYSGDASEKKVSLMFNVYQGTEEVVKIAEILGEYNVKATFFIGGCWADDNEKTLNSLVSNGHEIASHGYFHKDHKKLSYEKNKEEIINTEKVIEALCGVKTILFAPPSGSYGEVTVKAATSLGYKVIMWSKDTIDWRDKNADLIYKRATKNLKNGDFILMHPTPHTVLALKNVLDFYVNEGFQQVTVSENIGLTKA